MWLEKFGVGGYIFKEFESEVLLVLEFYWLGLLSFFGVVFVLLSMVKDVLMCIIFSYSLV